MEREQSERWKENNSGHYTESKAIQDLRNEGIANHTKCDGRSDKTEKSLWVVQLECTYKAHNKGISGNASLETVPLKKKLANTELSPEHCSRKATFCAVIY